MSTLSKAVAAAAVAFLSSCCSQPADPKTATVAQVPTAVLVVSYTPSEAGTFRADVRVDAGECTELPGDATAEVTGVALEAEHGAACTCGSNRFAVDGAAVPPTSEAMFRVMDASGDMSAMVPGLFIDPAVVLRSPATALVIGTRVYVDVVPWLGTLLDMSVSFTSFGAHAPAFTLRTSDGSLGQDGLGPYVDVPAVATGDGELTVSWIARPAASSCWGAARCDVTMAATRRLATSVVAP